MASPRPPNQPNAAQPLLLVIVGKGDALLFESNLAHQLAPKREDLAGSASDQFLCLAALEAVDLAVWGTPNMYCRTVERTPRGCVSAFVSANHTKLLLLHRPTRTEEGVKQFLTEVNELVVKLQLNPFHDYNATLYNAAFERRVQQLASRHLST